MDNRAIGIFDSGVGAFSVLEKLLKLLPNEEYIYFADSGHNPYGQKSKEQLNILCKCIVDFLLENDVKAIVIACNTATAASLEYLKKEFKNIDIIGVINPGVKEALKLSKNKKIGVCSTVFTAENHGYLNEILKVKSKTDDIKVQEEGSINLANIIENGFEYNEENEAIVRELAERFEDDIDTLILGCTHFPLIEDMFKKYFKGTLVDPAMQTALEVKRSLEKKDMLSLKKENKSIKYFVTRDANVFKKVAENITNIPIDDILEISMEDRLKKEGFKY